MITTLSYIWPLAFAIAADSGLGKTKAIGFGLIVYVIGMCMTAVGGMPEVFGDGVDENGQVGDNWWQDNIAAIRGVALGQFLHLNSFKCLPLCKNPFQVV